MHKAALQEAKNCDIFIGAAAVADYSPKEFCLQKIKKTAADLVINFQKTPDIIASIKQKYKNVFVVGFAAETENFYAYGLKKLKGKDLDIIAINDVSGGKVFGKDDNELHVVCRDKQSYFIKMKQKDKVAQELLEIIYNDFNRVS
jgi:phosphopantothenoylcysteine decarboxylase/phosphopantothenate--cysteine ligase